MRRNPGEWLRDMLLDRLIEAALLGTLGIGLLGGTALTLWIAPVPFRWTQWTLALFPGAVFAGAAIYKLKRGWRLSDMKKGALAEEQIGQAIEYGLTRPSCAVAHHVRDVAEVGDIDHLVATPRGLWVIESKHGRVPSAEFRETLRRIVHNVSRVRDWAPETQVTGCLVFATKPDKRPAPTFEYGAETIRCFEDRKALMRELRDDARDEAGSADLARRVWGLAKLEPPTAQAVSDA